MNVLWTDPVVLTAGGFLFVGIILFFWGAKRLFSRGRNSDPAETPIELEITSANDLPFSRPAATLPLAEQVNKEMATKLESMTQRLAEMQTLLNKQNAVSSAPALAPDTLDKMINNVNTVIQQVDLLQKSVESGSAPASAPAPVRPAPVSTPTPAAPKSSPSTPVVPISEIINRNTQNPPA